MKQMVKVLRQPVLIAKTNNLAQFRLLGVLLLTDFTKLVWQRPRCRMNYHGVSLFFRVSMRSSRVIAARVRV